MFRISIDALESLGNSAQTKASDHTLNIDQEHNNPQYERIVGLYDGSESVESHIRHYGDARMGLFHGTPLEQENALNLRPKVDGLINEIEALSLGGFTTELGEKNVHMNVLYIMCFDLPGMIKWRKLNSQTSRDGCPFCKKQHKDLYTDPETLAPLYEMDTLVKNGYLYEQELKMLLHMQENNIKTVSEKTGLPTKKVTKKMIEDLRWKYGVQGICMLPGMSKWQIAPDGLHCILNIHVLLWEMVSVGSC